MSKAKSAASSSSSSPPSSGGSFAQGFLLGQFTLALILFFFIKFFLFGDSPSADSRATARAAARRQRTLSHGQSLRKKRSSAALGGRHIPTVGNASNVLTTDKILDKTYYNVDGHQPESLDWFNVLIAQTVAQLRADALDDDAVLSSLTQVLNGPQKPDFLDEIKVTEISLGEEFPIFSNCRVIPVDEDGAVVKPSTTGRRGFGNALRDSRLQARMDVDLSDAVTLGIETKLLLNYPKPFVAVLPVALSVSVVRFSGTLSLSFTPSQSPAPTTVSSTTEEAVKQDGQTPQATHSPTTLTFTFLDDYRLDLSVHSLIGSRSRLQDVPKIAQLVEQRLHQWFDERCVEPRFQQIVLPSLWPRKKNVRGGDEEGGGSSAAGSGLGEAIDEADLMARSRGNVTVQTSETGAGIQSQPSQGAETQDGVAASGSRPPLVKESSDIRQRGKARQSPAVFSGDQDELSRAGEAMREAEERSRIRESRR